MASFGYVIPASLGYDVIANDDLWATVAAAERGDIEHLWVSDHLLWWHAMHESLTLLAAICARTERLKIGTAVLQLAMRELIATTKAVSSIQRLSGQRLILGVGVGGEFAPEWEATHTSRRTRGARTDEMLEAMRGLWTQGSFSYQGAHVEIDNVDLHPKVPPPPVWIGGRKDPALRRAARLGEGWMGLFLTPEMFVERVATLSELCSAQGKDPEKMTRSMYVWTCIADDDAAAKQQASELLSAFYNVEYERLERYAVVGSPETCAARFREFKDAGVQHFAVAPVTSAGDHDQLDRLNAEVMPLL